MVKNYNQFDQYYCGNRIFCDHYETTSIVSSYLGKGGKEEATVTKFRTLVSQTAQSFETVWMEGRRTDSSGKFNFTPPPGRQEAAPAYFETI